MCDDLRTRYDAAIKYFEEAITESDDIIQDAAATFDERMLLLEQKRHFITALAAMKACRDVGRRYG